MPKCTSSLYRTKIVAEQKSIKSFQQKNTMPSLQLTSQQLHAFAEKWNEEWKNAYFNQFRAVGENTFQFKINTKQEKISLLIKLPNLAWVSQRKWDVLETQPPIVNKTKTHFENQKINSITQH